MHQLIRGRQLLQLHQDLTILLSQLQVRVRWLAKSHQHVREQQPLELRHQTWHVRQHLMRFHLPIVFAPGLFRHQFHRMMIQFLKLKVLKIYS